MSFVDPNTSQDPTTGGNATAALLNIWRANHEFLRNAKAGCRARTNTATALSAGGTAIPFELEDFDNNACHSLVTNNSRLTVPTGWGGWYAFGFTCRLSTSGTFRVCKNGTNTAAAALLSVSAATTTSVATSGHGSSKARLAAGDYIELFGLSAGSVGTTFNPVFWMQFLAA